MSKFINTITKGYRTLCPDKETFKIVNEKNQIIEEWSFQETLEKFAVKYPAYAERISKVKSGTDLMKVLDDIKKGLLHPDSTTVEDK